MSLDELIEKLSQFREQAGGDMPLRLVFKKDEQGHQCETLDATLEEGRHGPITLIYAGEHVAIMEWPGTY